MSPIHSDHDTPPASEKLFEEHYQALLPKFRALAADELVPINLDIPAAVTTALGVAPEVRALKERLVRELPLLDLEALMKLDEYAMALMHAHTLYLMAAQPVDSLQPLVEEGSELREVLFADATALVQRRLLNGSQLRDLQGPVGYKNLAVDLQILAALFREHLPELAGKCATSPAELHRAEQIAAEILRTVGLREQGPPSAAATADMRARAYTVFMRAYDQARRAVSFLNWNDGDVATIAPSLFAGRSNGRRKHGSDAPAPAPRPETPAPVSPEGEPVAAGMPGAAPFVQ